MYPVLNSKFRLHKQAEESYVFLTDVNSVDFAVLNNTASEILELCDGQHSIEDICTTLADKYNEEIEKVKSFVAEFLENAVTANHIIIAEAKYALQPGSISGDYAHVFPLTMSIELTHKCPLRCVHCYNEAGATIKNKEMDPSQMIETILKFAEVGVDKVFLTGGEPLIYPKIREILEICNQHFSAITIATSGYSLTEELVDFFEQFKGKIFFQISLDGPQYIHNFIRQNDESFKYAVLALEQLSARTIGAAGAMTLNSLNINHIEETVKIVKDTGALEIRFGRTIPGGRAKHSKELSKQQITYSEEIIRKCIKKYNETGFSVRNEDEQGRMGFNNFLFEEKSKNCGAGYLIANMKPNGDITPCSSMSYVIGNFIKEGTAVFAKKGILNYRELPSPTKELCNNCAEIFHCDGCHGHAFVKSNIKNCVWKKQFKSIITDGMMH